METLLGEHKIKKAATTIRRKVPDLLAELVPICNGKIIGLAKSL